MLDAFDDDELDEKIEADASNRRARQVAGHGCPPLPPAPSPGPLPGLGEFIADDEGGWVTLEGGWFGAAGAKRQIRVRLAGPEGAPLLVYIAGTLTDFRKAQDRRPLKVLEESFRILAPDLRNSGRTRPFTWEESDHEGLSHAAMYADDVAEVVAVIFGRDARFHVAGFSSGASIAMWLAHRYPEHVRRLVNIAGGFFPNREDEFLGDDLEFKDAKRLLGTEDMGWFSAMTDFTPTLEERSRKIIGYVDGRYGEEWMQQNEGAAGSLCKALAQEERELDATEGYDRAPIVRGAFHAQVADFICGSPPAAGLAALAPQTLLVAGRHDRMHRPPRIEALQKKMPGVMVEWLDEGHNCTLSASAKIREFLLAE